MQLKEIAQKKVARLRKLSSKHRSATPSLRFAHIQTVQTVPLSEEFAEDEHGGLNDASHEQRKLQIVNAVDACLKGGA